MTAVYLSPGPPLQQFNQGGSPLAGGLLFTYASNTTSKLATYVDHTGNTANTNPIILDANGQCQIWLQAGVAYRYVLSPANDTDPPSNAFWTADGIVGMNSVAPPGAYDAAFAAAPPPAASISALTMQGIGGQFVPIRSGVFMLTLTGTMSLPAGSAAGVGIGCQLSFGLGTPPAPGAALTGIQSGSFQEETAPATIGTAGWSTGIFVQALIGTPLPLALNTLYWADLAAIALVTPSVAALTNVYLTAVEL